MNAAFADSFSGLTFYYIPYSLAFLNLRAHSKKGGPTRDMPSGAPRPKTKTLDKATIDMINEDWENNEMTTFMWEMISRGQFAEIASVLREQPELAHIRSEDGRGPMWWAYEYKQKKLVQLLKKLGVDDERTDANGVKAVDLKE